MDLSKISGKSWRRFEKEHPAAYNYLLRESLKGEFQILVERNMANLLNEWQEKRLAELRKLYRGRALMSNLDRKLDK